MIERDRDVLAEVLCRRHCVFFKPWKREEERCGGYAWLFCRAGDHGVGIEAVASLTTRAQVGLVYDALLGATICADCAFRAADCDFRDPNGPVDSVPCGGVLAIDALLEAGHLEPTDLEAKHRSGTEGG